MVTKVTRPKQTYRRGTNMVTKVTTPKQTYGASTAGVNRKT